MGVGMALFEETTYDPRCGAPMNNNLTDYIVTTNADAQTKYSTVLVLAASERLASPESLRQSLPLSTMPPVSVCATCLYASKLY
jgi:hypothetical protein